MMNNTATREGNRMNVPIWKRELSINTQQLVTMALLVALDIVLSRFGSINLWNTRIGFGFVPIVVAGMLLGGAFFPPLTVTAVLRGILYGIMLKYVPEYLAKVIDDPKKYQKAWIGVCAATTLFDQLAFGMLLQSYWLSLLYGSPYTGMMASRVLQIAILIPVEFVVLIFLPRLTDKLLPFLQSGKKGR